MKRQYTNTGESPLVVDGKTIEPGKSFKADLPPEVERRWYHAGSINRPKRKRKK